LKAALFDEALAIEPVPAELAAEGHMPALPERLWLAEARKPVLQAGWHRLPALLERLRLAAVRKPALLKLQGSPLRGPGLPGRRLEPPGLSGTGCFSAFP
jgi:hypothetical protein